ncbi:MAG: peroxidase-related enzyme [Bacteroidales bacterium]|nr:peroxidase-related enzyme [Bacteroidales bacterium]
MAHIEVIEPEEATGRLKEIYDDLARKRGKIAEVHKIQSLNPESIVHHMDLYLTIMFGKSPLKRVQREMMGVVVSKANQCEYCITHHLEAVKHYWKDDALAHRFKEDYTKVDLSHINTALCNYAWELTIKPEIMQGEYALDSLRKAGLDDRAILDATLVVSYFNFVNRMVLALGVDLESNPGGYTY